MTETEEHPITGIEEKDRFLLEQKEENRLMCTRRGDSFVTMFQCKNCYHQNIKKRDAIIGTHDEKLCRYIRRSNLDLLWSRETSTVNASHRESMMDMRLGKELGLLVQKA